MYISEKIESLIQFRIEQEELSSRIYLAMSKWLEFNGYNGAAKLWKKYSEEELNHASWSYDYLGELDIKPIVSMLEEPECEYKGLDDIINKSLEHEIVITNQCNDLAEASMKACDFMTLGLAQKYLKEQTEEIGKMTYWIAKVKAFGNSKEALYLLDNEMGQL